jgi:hypothetical protein
VASWAKAHSTEGNEKERGDINGLRDFGQEVKKRKRRLAAWVSG